ncbi:hypothetical protein [Fodinibius halophilus]|uniref:Uncharacterized protein n=1 Tax=Fodinibius halophilus TaxID=1736908 RepID=A0A6M1T857_9BACT|nr:hypothetical protein [Fodinibius halophilus]NGP87314.1 hypothetical protein [Fodinibius halophilus]
MDTLVALILIGFGTFLGGLIMWKLFDMVRSSINKNKKTSIDAEDFDRLARAFVQHKKKMEQRMNNIERAIAEKKDSSESYIELEAPPEPENELSNDLNEKEKIRS